MDQTTIISKLDSILPEIKSSKDPEGVMLKLARENNFAPAQLEKLAQVYNIAKTLTFMDKSASRGGTFTVVDTESLLKRYNEFKPAVKSANELESWFPTTEQVKSAAATDLSDWTEVRPQADYGTQMPKFVNGTPVFVEEKCDQMFKLAGVIEALHGEAELEFRSILKSAAETDMELMDVGQLIDDQEQLLRDSFTKLADHIRIHGTPFARLEEDCMDEDPAMMKSACDTASDYLTQLNVPHSRAEGERRPHLAQDRTGLLELMKTAAAALDLRRSAIKYASAVAEKKKGKGSPKFEPSTFEAGANPNDAGKQTAGKNPPAEKSEESFDGLQNKNRGIRYPNLDSDDSGEKPAPKPAEGKPGGGQKETFDAILGSIEKNVLKPGKELVDTVAKPAGGLFQHLLKSQVTPRSNKRQRLVDDTYEEPQVATGLQRLLTTDPILSKADPQQVASLAHSIRSAAPDAARDDNFMRFALREALQYDAMPLHTYKDLVAMQELKSKGEKTRNDIARERYSTSA